MTAFTDYEFIELKNRVAQLETMLGGLDESGLNRLREFGYLQFDGIPIRLDNKGGQVSSPDGNGQAAWWFVERLVPDPEVDFPHSFILGETSKDDGNSQLTIRSELASGAFGRVQTEAGNDSSTSGGVSLRADSDDTSSVQVTVFGEDAAAGHVSIEGGPVRLPAAGSDYSALANDGAVQYRTDTDKFRGRANGATDNFAMEGFVTTSLGSYIAKAFLDAKGDLITASAADTPAILTVGANDSILMADSAQSTGLKWAAAATTAEIADVTTGAESAGTSDTYARGDHVHHMASAGLTVSNQSSGFTASGNNYYRCTGTITATLTSAPADSTYLVIKNNGTGTITVARGGSDTIFTSASGVTSFTLAPGEAVDMIYYATGTEWSVF